MNLVALLVVLNGISESQEDAKLTGEGTRFVSETYGVTFSVPKDAVTLTVDSEQLKDADDENQRVLCMGAGSNNEILLYLTLFKKIAKGTEIAAYRASIEKGMSQNFEKYELLGGTSIDKIAERAGYRVQRKGESYRGEGVYRIEGDAYCLLMILVTESKWTTHRDTVEEIVKSLGTAKTAVVEDPKFDGETFTFRRENLKFVVPKGKGFALTSDREKLKDLGEKMLCVGTNDEQHVIFFLLKETAEEEMSESEWIEHWEKTWEEKLGGKDNYRKDGGWTRESGLAAGGYTIQMDGQERKAQVTYLNRGKEHFIFMVIGRGGNDWLADRDDVEAIGNSFVPLRKK